MKAHAGKHQHASASPEARDLPRNEDVFRSLLQATVRNMFNDDEDHREAPAFLVTPAHEDTSSGIVLSQGMETPILGQRLFATPVTPSVTSPAAMLAALEAANDEALLDAELASFEDFLKKHLERPGLPTTNNVDDLEAQVRQEHQVLLAHGLPVSERPPLLATLGL